ncbi:MAG TPA: TIM-barrel domain-containing protein [Steroidobacteraceae bacterium]|nr:TIM-barrel domain-containing protein [Steroidobacteraceae bacterium]
MLSVSANATVLDRNGALVSIEGFGPNIVRVTLAVDKDQLSAPAGYGISASADPQLLKLQSSSQGDDFVSSSLRVHVDPAPALHVPSMGERYFAPSLPPVALKVFNSKGNVVLDMTGWEMSPHVVNGEQTYQVGATFKTTPDEHFYGLGQNQEGILDLRNRVIDCKHWYDAPHGETVCVPFMVSSKGYGVVWDNPSATRVTPAVNGRTAWQSNVGERVSFFVIVGDTVEQLYSGYAQLTGRTPIPPKATFGLIQSKARYQSQQEVLDVAHGYRQRNYPLDIMVVDWFYWTRMGQLDIDPAQFPRPDEMNKELHSIGMQSIISVWPRFETASRYFNELDRRGLFLKDAKGKTQDGLPFRSDRTGALIDSTNPVAREWFWQKTRDNILSHGFDYLWLDETEPDLVPDGLFYSIGSGDRYHNVFPLLHVEGVAQGSRRDRPNKRNVILARAAYLGSQRTGALFWSSDINPSWDALQRQVPTGLNYTASGLAYWGNDIGGWQWLPQATTCNCKPLVDPAGSEEVAGKNYDYPELFVRWFQYGTFLPTLRIHGDRKKAELWVFGKHAEEILAKYDRWRYQLIPYLYSQAKQTYDTGAPFMRALWMDFPNDRNVYNIGNEYMFGPAFLVAPVTEQGQLVKTVYLPAGTDWYNYWTNEKYTGGQTVSVASPIDQIPLFVRAGSIIPVGSDIQSTATKQSINEIKVYPGKDADFSLYDDDGVTYDYEKGKGIVVGKLHWDDAKKVLTSTGDGRFFNASVQSLLKVQSK